MHNRQKLREDCLTYAMTATLLLTAGAVGAVYVAGGGALVVLFTAGVGAFLVFTVVPHAVAIWLDVHVDRLLGIRSE
jgi:hypothetical protein